MRFGENNVLGPIYIENYKFRGWVGDYMVHLTFFYYLLKLKNTRVLIVFRYTEIKFYIIFLETFFLG